MLLIINFKITEKHRHFKCISLKMIKLTHQIEDELTNNQENITGYIIRNIITSYDSLNEQIEYDHPEEEESLMPLGGGPFPTLGGAVLIQQLLHGPAITGSHWGLPCLA